MCGVDYDFPVIVREATAADRAALQALAAASPDGGAVTFRREQHVPAGQIPSAHEISEHFVAEIDGVIAGAALLNLGTCRFEGEDARYALLDRPPGSAAGWSSPRCRSAGVRPGRRPG
jgi:hypothetical protein